MRAQKAQEGEQVKITTANFDESGNLKFNLQNYPPAWRNISGGKTSNNKIQHLREKVAFFYRSSKLVASHSARIPYKVIDTAGETVTDSSDDFFKAPYQWLDDYDRLMQLTVLSLIQTGTAYLLKNYNRLGDVLELQYVIPESMTPKYHDDGTLSHFERVWSSPDSGTQNSERIELDDMVYIWSPDPSVENEAPNAFDGEAAFSGASVLYNMQKFKNHYFENGAIKVGFVTYADRITQKEAKTIETYFRRMIAGINNAWKQVVTFRKDIEYQHVGEGLESLDNDSLTATEQRDVMAALGVPPDLVIQPSGGMDSDVTSAVVMFYDGTVVPLVQFIHQQFNKQLLGNDAKLVATPEALPIFAEDENERADQLKRLVDAGMDLTVAMRIAGYSDDLIAEQERINEANEQKAREVMQAQEEANQAPPEVVETTQEPNREEDEIKALRNWCKKRKGKQAHPSDFKSDVIGYDTIADVMEDYGIYTPPLPVNTANYGDTSLTKFIELFATKNETPQNITVNVTPEAHTVNVEPTPIKNDIVIQPASVNIPDVVVNLPEANTVVNVEAPQVKIDNTVEMPKRMIEKTQVKRNANGLIESTESTSTFED
jgi:HK97 family phage portal protein